uniref:Uncharacterized protein n=1 Tax=Amphimedon queenslandica TaxID=400682 RepID=A0A1X7VDC3_AMPQE
MTIIDPMHNLFTGTAKHITINICVPSSVGRIPHKIATNMSSFTADLWKNWILHFSLVALHKEVTNDDFECWKS